jgi:fatty-acyl-CoA synthase
METGYIERTIHHAVERNARLFPQREALIVGDKRLTWRELHYNCNRAANALLKLGINKDEKVGCMLRNCNQFVEIFVACLEIRTSPININYRYKEEELHYILDNGDVTVLVCHPEYEVLVEAVRPRLPLLRQVVVIGPSRVGNIEWDSLIEGLPVSIPKTSWGRGMSTDEFLFFTGGTTGMPKGVIWPHENFIQTIANSVSHAVFKNFKLLAQNHSPGQDKLMTALELPFRSLPFMKYLYIKALGNRLVMEFLSNLVAEKGFMPPGFSPLLYNLSSAMKILIGSPLMHGAAWVGVVSTICAGGTMYFLPDSLHFDPHALWAMVEKERVKTVVVIGDAFAVPLLDALEQKEYDLGSIICLASGAVKLSTSMKDKLHEKLPHALIADTLIATEGGGAVSEVSTATDGSKEHRFKIASTGKFPVMVIDENKQFVKPGSKSIGRLAYGGPQSKGYWKDPQKTAQTYITLGGKTWVMVGDMCSVDEDGSISFIGRSSDCINSGGEKIYPDEIENVIMSHQAVYDVAVVGIPHPRWGSAAAAVIQLNNGFKADKVLENDLNLFVHDRLSDYKCPRYWIFVDALDRTDAGKVQRNKIQELAIAMVGLNMQQEDDDMDRKGARRNGGKAV